MDQKYKNNRRTVDIGKLRLQNIYKTYKTFNKNMQILQQIVRFWV